MKLKEALSDLTSELKYKEIALNESEKLIKKINEEYSSLVKEYKKLHDEHKSFRQSENINKKIIDSVNKNNTEFQKIVKQNSKLKNDLATLKSNMNSLRDNFMTKAINYDKIEKENKDKEILINGLQIEGNNFLNMLQEREMLIENYSKKINELNEIIKQKDDQLKLMVNFSKEINDENKFNIKELTKQAINTIKMIHNKEKDNNTKDNIIEIKIDNNNNVENNFDNLFKQNKCHFVLNDAIKNLLFLPKEGVNYINKEFLIDENIKTCLLKTELFASYIRENKFYNLINELFVKLKEIEKQAPNINANINKIINFKIAFDKLIAKNNFLTLENFQLKKKLTELDLYINKLKKDFNSKTTDIKNKVNILIKKNSQNYKKINDLRKNSKKSLNSTDINNKTISKLHKEIDKINNDNHNLSHNISEKENIITNLKSQNEKLISKLNALRTNPSTEKSAQYLKNKRKSANISNFSNYKTLIPRSNEFILSSNDYTYNSFNTNTLRIQNKDCFSLTSIDYLKNLNSLSLNEPILNNFINSFKSEVPEVKFYETTNKNFKASKILKILYIKIEEILKNLFNIKQKFKTNHHNKKIKPNQLIDILEQVEKLLEYVHKHINTANNDFQNSIPNLNNIFNFVSQIAYNTPFKLLTNNFSITLYNSNLSYFNSTATENILDNNQVNTRDKIINLKTNFHFNNEYDDTYDTYDTITPNMQELKQFFEFNKKIFSSSELIKYYNIYQGLSMNELIKIFKNVCIELKKNISNSKNEYETDMSEFEESNSIKNKKSMNENNNYHIVSEKIFKLKKFEFDYKIFMEILKNYLVAFECVVKIVEKEIDRINKEKRVKLGEEMNILFNIFEETIYYKLYELDDDTIFSRKIIMKLLQNHKEYAIIVYDL